ncbi:MAG: folate-binding protein YgfZ [Pirellulales bacterium]|nr:folate-binding protein YgfZ [Pirellulales bacterium]
MSRESLEREHALVTQAAGAVPLDRWSTVRVTGGDRASFLHNMCTNDVKGLSSGSGCEAFFTDVKGKIVAHAFILAGDDETLLITVPEQAAKLIAHLDRYIIREDVKLADASADIRWMLVMGHRSDAAVNQLMPSLSTTLTAPWSHARNHVGDAPIQFVRCDVPWCGGYFLGSSSAQAAVLQRRLAELEVPQGAEALWQAIRVESAWPLWGVDFDDSNLPQEVGRDATAIHFRKGCYLGQETVARIDALGHVNKKLVQIRFAGDAVPQPGAEVSQGDQLVGRVTSANWSPQLQSPLALAMVRRGANETGTTLQWNGVPAEVVELPTPPTAA